MTEILTKQQIEDCRLILGALTIDASKGDTRKGEILLKQPEWANRVNALCDLAIETLKDGQKHGHKGIHVWPDKLTIRDTGITADEGQRIFTTATGYGYPRCEYVLAEKAERLAAALSLIWQKDTQLAWSGGSAPEPSHDETGEFGKIAAGALAEWRGVP